jgi:hypothetical protein
MAARDFENLLRLCAVEMLVNVPGRKLLRYDANIGRDHPVGAVVLLQGRHKLRPNLPQRSGDQNSPHANPRGMPYSGRFDRSALT